jgi:hypothetical protein
LATHLPNVDRAFIASEKIVSYLLSHDHPRGAAKADFFESFGFTKLNWNELRDAFLDHAASGNVVGGELTAYGRSFEVNGRLETPDGRIPFVLVVWMIRTGEDFPRFVTAVPSEEYAP